MERQDEKDWKKEEEAAWVRKGRQEIRVGGRQEAEVEEKVSEV